MKLTTTISYATRTTKEIMSSKYKAVEVAEVGKLNLVERIVPEPGAGQVRIRVEACGICHSDAATVYGRLPGITFPRVPGHEVVGRIDALGAGVSDWKIGQRVGVGFLGGHCGHCQSCRRGDFVNCSNQPISGGHFDGGYAEVMLAFPNGLVSVPDGLTSVEAAPLLCAGLTTYNALRKSSALPGDLVAVQGIGGLGHLGVQYAAKMGFRVVAIARGAEKAALAKKLGAHHYIDTNIDNAAAALQKLGGAKIIIATASDSKSMSGLIGGLRPRGKLIVLGAGTDPIPVSPLELLFGSRSIEGALTGSSIDNEDTLAFSLLQNIRAVIETFPLEKAPEAFAKMMKNEARYRIVLTMQ
ncbi:MAG: alcohol dehydrogenase [Limisphaerales bacterium]